MWEEDSFGRRDAMVWPLRATTEPRIYEIGCAQDWTRLVTRYPLEVTAGRRHDWYRVTGRDGRWQIPDYAAAARDFDGIHITVAGYLSSATRLLELGNGAATMVSGFAPDQCWWLNDILAVDGAEQRWHDYEDEEHNLPGDPGHGWRDVTILR